jgi:hypothetical protein
VRIRHHARVDLPPEVADVVAGLAASVRPVAGVTAFYAAGSLASGDFRLGVSDYDLVAVTRAALSDAQQHDLESVHQRLLDDEPRAAKLHCVYVPVPEIADVSAAHLTWAHGELYRRPLSGIARAELLEFGIPVYGPAPDRLIPPVSRAELDAAVRGELSGYWRGVVAKPHLWLQDVFVDIGLFTLARAEATLTEGRLITKTEALPRLAGLGVPVELVGEIERRRQGEDVRITLRTRQRRARDARRVMAAGITRLVG